MCDANINRDVRDDIISNRDATGELYTKVTMIYVRRIAPGVYYIERLQSRTYQPYFITIYAHAHHKIMHAYINRMIESKLI